MSTAGCIAPYTVFTPVVAVRPEPPRQPGTRGVNRCSLELHGYDGHLNCRRCRAGTPQQPGARGANSRCPSNERCDDHLNCRCCEAGGPRGNQGHGVSTVPGVCYNSCDGHLNLYSRRRRLGGRATELKLSAITLKQMWKNDGAYFWKILPQPRKMVITFGSNEQDYT